MPVSVAVARGNWSWSSAVTTMVTTPLLVMAGKTTSRSVKLPMPNEGVRVSELLDESLSTTVRWSTVLGMLWITTVMAGLSSS